MIRSGNICISFLYKFLTSEIKYNGNGGDELIKKATRLKCLSDTFASYGGVLAKISQILCFEDGKGDIFSDCKPYCQKETIDYFKDEYTKNPNFFKNVKEIDFNVFKAGSVGQIHKAIYTKNDDKEIIIKVQYIGLVEQFKSDIFLLDKLITYLFNFSNISNAMIDIKTKLYEELDYTIEFENQNKFYEIWKDHEYIKIPKLIPELCTKTLLGMEFIMSDSLSFFIENSTQEERNNIGNYIVEFVFTNLYKYGIFYSDIHYGNFLIQNNNILYITDFGCINELNTELLDNMKKLHNSIINNDKELFYIIVSNMGILNDDKCSDESKQYMYDYFKLQYTPWIDDNEFEFTEEWLIKSTYKETELMNEWILPSNCVYLNKIPYGLYHILTKLKLKGNFKKLFNKIL